MAWLASAFSSIRARCPKKLRRRDLMTDENGTVCMNVNAIFTLSFCCFRSFLILASNCCTDSLSVTNIHTQCRSGPAVSASDCGVRGSRFESYSGRLRLSQTPLSYAVLGTGCTPLLQCLGQLNLASHWVAISSTNFGWSKGRNDTSAGWQVTLCDPI